MHQSEFILFVVYNNVRDRSFSIIKPLLHPRQVHPYTRHQNRGDLISCSACGLRVSHIDRQVQVEGLIESWKCVRDGNRTKIVNR